MVAPDEYVGSALLNQVVSVLVGGADIGVTMNDGAHLLPYFAKLSEYQHSLLLPIETTAEWDETTHHAAEDGVLLVAFWHGGDSCADSAMLLPQVEEVAVGGRAHPPSLLLPMACT